MHIQNLQYDNCHVVNLHPLNKFKKIRYYDIVNFVLTNTKQIKTCHVINFYLHPSSKFNILQKKWQTTTPICYRNEGANSILVYWFNPVLTGFILKESLLSSMNNNLVSPEKYVETLYVCIDIHIFSRIYCFLYRQISCSIRYLIQVFLLHEIHVHHICMFYALFSL